MDLEGELVLRAASPDDCKPLAKLHFLIHTTSFAEFAEQQWVEARKIEDYFALWCEYLNEQPERERTWIAEIRSKIVGTVTIMNLESSSRLFRPSSLEPPYRSKVACLRLMYVHPDFQRQGIGRALLEASDRFLQMQGYQAASLITHAVKESARAFYEQMGWRLDEIFKQQVEEFFEEPARMRLRARYVRVLGKRF